MAHLFKDKDGNTLNIDFGSPPDLELHAQKFGFPDGWTHEEISENEANELMRPYQPANPRTPDMPEEMARKKLEALIETLEEELPGRRISEKVREKIGRR